MTSITDRELLARMFRAHLDGQWWHASEATLRLESEGLCERYPLQPSGAESWRVTGAGLIELESGTGPEINRALLREALP